MKKGKESNRETAVNNINERIARLEPLAKEMLIYFDKLSCQCAFPRFRQIAAIDCVDYRESFYCLETEFFIAISAKYFDIKKLDTGAELHNEEWTCKKCGSVYSSGWSDFSINVNRTVLKVIEMKTETIGAETLCPIPLFAGLIGHSYPGETLIIPVGFEEFKEYISELKK